MAVILFSACSNTPDKIEVSINGVKTQLKNLDFKKAENILEQLKASDTTSPDNIYVEGLIYEYKMLYIDALAQYETLIESYPEYADAYAGAYRCYKNLGSSSEMFASARGYKNFAPDAKEGNFIMAEALLEAGDYFQARRNYQLINAESENPTADIYIAYTFAIQDLKDSTDFYLKRGKENSDLSDYRFVKALSDYYNLVGQNDSSLTVIQEYINQHPYELSYYIDYFKLALSLGYYSETNRVINLLEEKNISPYITKWLNLKLAYDRDDSYYIRNQISYYFMLNNKLLTLILRSMQARSYLVEEKASGQDYIYFTGQLARSSYPQRFKEFGKYYATLEIARRENSTASYSDLTTLEGGYAEYRESVTAALLNAYKIGLFDEAIARADSLKQEYTGSPVWLNDLGKFYADEDIEKYAKAAGVYRLALASRPLFPELFGNFINMYIQKKDYKEALKLYNDDKLLRNDPAFDLVKAKLYLLDDQFDQFTAQLEKGLKVDSGNIRELKRIYDILLKRENKEEMSAYLNTIKNYTENNSQLLLLAGELSLYLEEYDEASVLLSKAEKLDPVDPNIQIHKARSLFYNGDKEDAYKIFEEIVKSHPNMPDNNMYYSLFLASENKDMQKAANLARGAVFGSMGTSKYQLHLSYVYYMMGRYDLAKGEAYKAMTTDRTNPETYYQLGRSWAKLSDREGYDINAIDALNKSIELGLRGEHLEEANKLLKALK